MVGQRCEDVQDECIVPITGRRRLETGAAAEAAIRVFISLLAKDHHLEFGLLCFVIGLLFRFEPPEVVGERKIGEDERELHHLAVVEELRVGDCAVAGPDVGCEAMENGVNLANCRIAPVHFLSEIPCIGREMNVLVQIVGRSHEHSTGTGGGIIDRVALLRFKHAH